MTIDKSNLNEDEKMLAEQCENAINQMHVACFSGLAVLDNDEIYSKIKDKIPSEQQTQIDDIIVKATQLHEATQ